MLHALNDVAGELGGRVVEHAPQRRAIIAASPELHERGHATFAAVAAALAAALRARGPVGPTAQLVADVGVALLLHCR